LKEIATVLLHDDVVEINTPYHNRFVEDLKEAVPSCDREWSAATKTWIVSIDSYEEAEEVLSRYFNIRVKVAPK